MGREKQRFGCNKRELQPLKITWVKVTYPSQRHLRSLVSRCSRPNLLAVSLACLRAHAKPPWRDAGSFQNKVGWVWSEHGYRTGCRNVSHCHQQQSYSGLRSPRRSNSTYFWSHYSLSVVMITRQFGNRKEIEKLRVRVLALRQSFVKGGGGGG